MANLEITTSISINATPQRVWDVLTNFDRYPEWNPFVTKASGLLKTGEQLAITAGGMAFKPEVLKAEPRRELRWLGKLLFSGLFDGEHYFIIEDHGNGTVTLHHGEKFRGLLVGPFAKKLRTETKVGFEEMNVALKERVEGGWSGSNTAQAHFSAPVQLI